MRQGNGFAFALALASALFLGAGGAAAGQLTGHHAVYRMALGTADSSTGINDARGAMMYRFADRCDGWTVENRTVLRIQYDEGAEVETVWTFVSWESRDGLSYRFRVHHERDGETVEDLRGTANLDGASGRGVARFVQPADTRIELPAGTLFPTAHLLSLFDTAAGGGLRLARVVFDGSSLDNPFEISAMMKALAAGERKAMADALGLVDKPAWHMRMAFFPVRTIEALPEFELEVRYREDGIADSLMQDFGDFALDLTLSDFQLLPLPDC